MASVKVAVRVRPLNDRELRRDAQCIVQIRDRQIQLLAPTGDYPSPDSTRTKTFTYDFSYWSVDAQDEHFASQEMVFSDLGAIVLDAAFCGYNACVFAYGQTGAGKTYSMMGWDSNAGLTPRICHGLFGKASEGDDGATYRAEVSYLEIYNERVRDLMVDGDIKNRKPHNLRVREHPMSGPYVEGLSKHTVTSVNEVLHLIDLGNKNRTTAATQMNDVSSRSHAIFTMNFTQARIEDGIPCETASKINLVDLAGSERVEASGATGDRLREGSNINKSLSTLGLVISALATRSQNANKGTPDKKPSFIPYRDSVVTWLLKDSIGGNAKTIMLAAISPADINYGETLSTLRYATRAKSIVNKPVINEDPTARLIRELRKEIEDLHKRLHQVSEQESPSERHLQTRLHQNEALVATLTNQWEEKWQRAHTIMQSKGLTLSDVGATVTVDTEKPYLVAIDHDPLNASVTMCYLQEGTSHIGSDPTLDIVLNGNGIQSHHCSITVDNDDVVLRPSEGAFCCINGEQVINEAKLWQGCIMKLGESHLFRFNHPAEAARMREMVDIEQTNTQFQRVITAEKLGLTPPRRGASQSSGWPGHASLQLEIDKGLDKLREGQRVMEALFRQQKQKPAEPVLDQCDRDIWMIEEKIRQDQHRLNMQRTQLKQLVSQVAPSQRDVSQNQLGFAHYDPTKSQPLFKSHSESDLDEVELNMGYNRPRRTPSRTNTRFDFSKERMDRVRRDSASLQVQIDETEQRLQAEKETLRILRQQQLGVDIQESKEESGESMKLVTYDQDNTEEETEVRYQTDSGSSWVVVNRRTSQGRSSPAVDQLHPEAHGKGPRKTVLEVFYRSKDSASGIRSTMGNGRSVRDEDVDIFERSVQDLNFDAESLSEANLLDMEQPMGQRPETMGEEQGKGDRFEDSDSVMRSSHLSWRDWYQVT